MKVEVGALKEEGPVIAQTANVKIFANKHSTVKNIKKPSESFRSF